MTKGKARGPYKPTKERVAAMCRAGRKDMCPDCTSLNIHKDGKTSQGTQRWRCVDCNRRFKSGRQNNNADKFAAFGRFHNLDKGDDMVSIARFLNRSRRTIYYWKGEWERLGRPAGYPQSAPTSDWDKYRLFSENPPEYPAFSTERPQDQAAQDWPSALDRHIQKFGTKKRNP